MRYALLSVVLLVVGIAFPPDGSRASAQEPAPSPGAKIAFTSTRDGNAEIYVMNPDGTTPVNLTRDPSPDVDPTWSPDANRIAFTSYRDGNWEIYVMGSDGTNQTRLTNNPARDSDPAWSPDGTKIAFTSWRDGNGEIYVMNADGTNTARLTNDAGTDQDPAWSPDGSRIAFQSDPDGHDQIYVMNSDGTNQTRLSNTQTWDLLPSWSPDGSKITFTSSPDAGGNFDIYVMNSDGTNQTRLTDNPAHDAYSRWSPDGEWIVFHSSRDGDSEIYVMRADGTNQTNLTNNPAFDGWPSWSPAPVSSPTPTKAEATLEITSDPSGAAAKVNGWEAGTTPLTMNFNLPATATQECTVTLELTGYQTWSLGPFAIEPGEHKVINAKLAKVAPQGKIVFAADYDRDPEYPGPASLEIYVMNADGTNQTRLTYNPGGDYAERPSWSPDGSKIAFVELRSRGIDIYVMNADGTNQINLTNNPIRCDSSDTAYASRRVPVLDPSWSPDGSKIAFSGHGQICVMNADGTNVTQLTTDPALHRVPYWSPDGSKIAFESIHDDLPVQEHGTYESYKSEFYVINSDGTNQTPLTTVGGAPPHWSPDGSKILFCSRRDGNWEIYVMNSDGTNQRCLSDIRRVYGPISWSPDGSKIVFISDRDAPQKQTLDRFQIYVMNADGSNQTRLTNTPAYISYPSWSPF